MSSLTHYSAVLTPIGNHLILPSMILSAQCYVHVEESFGAAAYEGKKGTSRT